MQINGLRVKKSLFHDNHYRLVRAAGVDLDLDFLGIDSSQGG
jgi:hypothetical protein